MKRIKTITSWLLLGTLSVSLLAAPALSAEGASSEQGEQSEPTQISQEYIAEPSGTDPVAENEPQEEPAPDPAPGEPAQEEPVEEEPAAQEEPATQEPVPTQEEPAAQSAQPDSAADADTSAEDAASSNQDAGDFATETVVSSYSYEPRDDSGLATNPSGSILSTLRGDDVSGSVAEAGYFPSKSDILSGRVSGAFTASMILWHRDNGASVYRIKDTTTFASAFGGTAQYTPRPGDLIYYQAYQNEYDASILTSGNSNWLHTGIVAEVGEDYIVTIEGNTSQRVSRLTLTRTSGVIGRYTDYRRSWVVNVFGDDDEARASFVDTAWQAWYDAEKDARAGRSGFGTWRESRYNGVYQNDTIASGYFQMPAAWCQMFVLWCSFNADVVRTGTVSIALSSLERPVISVIAQGQSLEGYEFSFYPLSADADYAAMEPSFVITTDVNGMGECRHIAYGDYHVEQTGGETLGLEPLDFTLAQKELGFSVSLSEDDAEDSDGIVSSLVDNLAALTPGHAGKMYVPELPETSLISSGRLGFPGSDSGAGRAHSTAPADTSSAGSDPFEAHAAGTLAPLTDATAILA